MHQTLDTFYDVRGKHLCEAHYFEVSRYGTIKAEKRTSVLQQLKY